MPRRPTPRPDGPVDPRLEEAAARALENVRGKAVRPNYTPQAGKLAAAIVRPLLPAKREKSLDELKRQWPEIVGEKLALMTQPEKLSGSGKSRVLTIKVAGPAAPFVQHQQGFLLERCNLAGAALSNISIQQGVIARPTGSNLRPLSKPLSAAEERALAQTLADVDNPKLKAALMRLGRAVAARG